MAKKNARASDKVDTIEKLAILVHEGFERIDERFERMDKRFDEVDAQLHDMRAELADIRRRIERLEALGANHAGFTKEIDHLIARVTALEKRLARSSK